MLKNPQSRVEVYGALGDAIRKLANLVDAGLASHRIMDDSELKDHDSAIYKAAFLTHKLLGEILDENGPAMKGLSAAAPWESPAGQRMLNRPIGNEPPLPAELENNPIAKTAQRMGLLPADAE